MKNQAEVCKLLRDARHAVNLHDLLPSPFKLTVGAHDTGCQPFIWACAEGLPQVLVWQGSIWYSWSYEFNDRNKVLGYQPDCEWAEPILEKFFSDVAEAWATIQADRALKEAQRTAGAERQYKDAVAAYKALVGGEK